MQLGDLVKLKNGAKKTSLFLKVSLFLAILILAVAVWQNTKRQGPPQASQFFTGSQNLQKPSPSPARNASLEAIFQNEIPQLLGKWAIMAKDLKMGQAYQFNQDGVFEAASIYKLAVMWAVYDAHLENDETVKRQLDSMITISDNDSAVALAERLGWTNITKLMQKEGLGGFDLSTETPTVTAKSILGLLKRI